LQTNTVNALSRQRFAGLAAELGQDTFLLVDDSNANVSLPGAVRLVGSAYAPHHKVLLYNEQEARSACQFHKSNELQKHTSVALLHAYLQPIRWRFIWVIERDAVCHGSWKECLGPVADRDTDFLTVGMVAQYSQSMSWPWWTAMEGQLSSISLDSRFSSFFPVVRCSKRMVADLHQQLDNSGGFSEASAQLDPAAHLHSQPMHGVGARILLTQRAGQP